MHSWALIMDCDTLSKVPGGGGDDGFDRHQKKKATVKCVVHFQLQLNTLGGFKCPHRQKWIEVNMLGRTAKNVCGHILIRTFLLVLLWGNPF